MTSIIKEYELAYAMWRKGKRLLPCDTETGRKYPRACRANDENYLQDLRNQIGYVTFQQGNGTFKVLNIPGRVEAVTKKLLAVKPPKTVLQLAAAEYRDQMRTYATPKERARIMGELIAAGEYQEVEPVPVPRFDWNALIPQFIPERIAT